MQHIVSQLLNINKQKHNTKPHLRDPSHAQAKLALLQSLSYRWACLAQAPKHVAFGCARGCPEPYCWQRHCSAALSGWLAAAARCQFAGDSCCWSSTVATTTTGKDPGRSVGETSSPSSVALSGSQLPGARHPRSMGVVPNGAQNMKQMLNYICVYQQLCLTKVVPNNSCV